MSMVSNIDRVGRGLDLLAESLEPFIARVLARHLPEGVTDWTLLLAAKDGIAGKEYSATDPQVQLRVLTEPLGALRYVFSDDLSRAEQNLASELRAVRDAWAHRKPFSPDDAYRALDTMERLLKAIGAGPAADSIRRSRLDVQRSAYADETRRDTQVGAGMPALSSTDLTPWREVLEPHPDIAANDFARAEFAADLHQVATGTEASADYNDPIEFFQRTYLTQGLKNLLGIAVRRLSGDMNAAPVVNLQTAFGGGKTHSMLAVWHLFSGRPITDFPQSAQDVVRELDVDPAVILDGVRRVAVVGNELAPGQSWTKPDGTEIRTLWGEIAWQLGGASAYAKVADADRTGTNPGAAIRDVIAEHSPAVILIDEWVAYARGLYGQDSLVGGTFETQFSFAQQLTEAVKSVPGALLLVSIPASDIRRDDDAPVASDLEVGGAHGRAALERLQNVVTRIAQPWTPASSTESFEIVRRRLFREPDAAARRRIDATAKTFVEYYRRSVGELPAETRDAAYESRIRDAYPIHPELFDRLYGDWSTLEKFQRTRGVLRLMSAVVHALHSSGDASPLIMPGSIPLDAPAVRDELTGYLDDGDRWKSVVESDIDGANGTAIHIDQEKPLFGNRALTRRIARATFIGSAATLRSNHKGIERKRMFLGVAMPGDTIGNFGSALQLLSERATYLYAEGERHWFDLQVSLNRTVAERAQSFSAADVEKAVVDRLRRQTSAARIFADVVFAPSDSSEVVEGDRVRLVVAGPAHTHDGKTPDSKAHAFARSIASSRGTAPRQGVNTVVVLAPDQARWADLEQATRQYLAWEGIHAERGILDLTHGQIETATQRITALNKTVDQRIRETWIWGIHPQQPDASAPWTTSQVKADGATDSVIVTAAERFDKVDAVITRFSMQSIGVELQNSLRSRWNAGSIRVGELWDFHVRYPYLARLRDKQVLLDAIAGAMTDPAWEQLGFALADGYDAETGDFEGLRIPIEDAAPPVVTDTMLLVSPRLATEQRARETAAARARTAGVTPGAASRGAAGGSQGAASAAPQPAPPRSTVRNARYRGSIELKPGVDLRQQVVQLAEELLEHLRNAAPDTLEIRVDIDAGKSDGFPDGVVRTVKENGAQLGLYPNAFEDL
ncbi:Swt1 family HEPN domain-containing protein [Microbacterium dauci]|uniref:Swt1 family HEPN domain-containing protein n=1 Tax=Microbacterium dauci TaxID=3048008 RepID=A0ABT6ZB60_9MICO|nr:Swt1 family HEPN domain-containing protein [Microbacterium sp. LX3-4]MDJ1113391.1 Swt1 family HEPN domain-containing protein [Microbacterium sp. LX3-4]